MRYRGVTEMMLISLAVIGVIGPLAVLSMGLMHITMPGWRCAHGR